MPSNPRAEQVLEGWADDIAILYEATTNDPADMRAASEAAANLLSGAGSHFLYAPAVVHSLVSNAIETGYITALRDVRDGKVDNLQLSCGHFLGECCEPMQG